MNKSIILITILSISAVTLLYFSSKTQKVSPFDQWKQDFGFSFKSGQEQYRKLIFQKNLQIINNHNADPLQTYKKGVNQFTIYTDQQFKHKFLAQMIIPQKTKVFIQQNSSYKLPTSAVDWTVQGKVSNVKDQGYCGSCWAFSATAVIQSWALFDDNQWDLSQQQLVDCTHNYGNYGCDGGWPTSALNYVRDSGLQTQDQYPYTARDQYCLAYGGNYKINTILNAYGCNGIANAITSRPLSITVDATLWSSYAGGIFKNCGSSINHAVLLVGIDQQGTWKIKNSWGKSWGQQGYIRLAGGNTCGICNYPGVYVE